MGKEILASGKKTFRPYDVYLDGKEYGTVFQTEEGSLLSRITYHQFVLDDTVYSMYPILFGAEGMKNPVYRGMTQIAQIEKDNVIYDDLHHYRIFAADEAVVLIAVIFCSYLWVNAFYMPGTVVSSSVKKIIGKTTDRRLLKKYDPTFTDRFSKL